MQVHDAQVLILGVGDKDGNAALTPPDGQLVNKCDGEMHSLETLQTLLRDCHCPLLQEELLQAIAVTAGVASTVLDKCHQQVPAVLREVAEAMHDMLLVRRPSDFVSNAQHCHYLGCEDFLSMCCCLWFEHKQHAWVFSLVCSSTSSPWRWQGCAITGGNQQCVACSDRHWTHTMRSWKPLPSSAVPGGSMVQTARRCWCRRRCHIFW